MERDTYKVISRFTCCGVDMVTVIIGKKAACVMSEFDFKRISNEYWPYTSDKKTA